MRSLLLSVLLFALSCAASTSFARRKNFGSKLVKRSLDIRQQQEHLCQAKPIARIATAPKQNPWASLTSDEIVSLLAWIHEPAQGLNLTAYVNATAWSNAVTVTELLSPNKTDVLNYLDNNGPFPPRYARVEVLMSATDEPYIQELQVGPLPISVSTTVTPLEYIYTRKSNGRIQNPSVDGGYVNQFAQYLARGIRDITRDLINGTIDDDFYLSGNEPYFFENGRVIAWLTFWRDTNELYDSSTLQPQGLFMKLDITGRDQSKWKLRGWLYNNIMYNSTKALRRAWESPGFVKLPINNEGDWTGTQRRFDQLPLETEEVPLTFQPTGKRYTVDEASRYVQWMDFSFYLGWDRDTGLSLHDVRYKGQRILYELGLQEAVAHYAGSDPTQSGTAYLDTYYGFGPYAYELVAGYDCPAYATYLNTTIHQAETTINHNNSLCLFEQDMGYPLRRHTSDGYVNVAKNVAFIIRTVNTVGNYDYMFDYSFYLDGSLEVKVRASGYIQAMHYQPLSSEYGYKIQEALSGAMHDHVLNFKADFDILGTENTLEQLNIVPKTTDYVWSDGQPRNTMSLERCFITNENEASLNWQPNAGTMYVVVNKDQPNPWGEYRGYRIMPGAGTPAHLTVRNSSNLVNSDHFARHHLFVTKQKDTELRSSYSNNALYPSDPLVDFSKFLDGENIEQEDIVVWFNLGMHHVPHTGDLPNTVFTTAQSSVVIAPHNYLLGDPSVALTHQVDIRYNAQIGTYEVNTEQLQPPTCAVNLDSAFPSLKDYHGYSQFRKFPYDPTDAIYELYPA